MGVMGDEKSIVGKKVRVENHNVGSTDDVLTDRVLRESWSKGRDFVSLWVFSTKRLWREVVMRRWESWRTISGRISIRALRGKGKSCS